MWRKTLPLIATVALVAAACGGPAVMVNPGPVQDVFIPQVVDFEGDAGAGVSLTTDGEGNPHLAYLVFEEGPEEGDGPAQPDPTAPKLPAVKHAHLVESVWTRSLVAEGLGGLRPDDRAAIALDRDGVHHVAWTVGARIAYASNAEGDFATGPSISAAAEGLSVAAGGGGVWVAYHERGEVKAARLEDGSWTVETVAPANPSDAARTAVGVSGSGAVVAFGDGGRTMVARQITGGGWSTEVADATGGLGVSMSIDGNGNPHLAYATSGGEVRHAHSIGGTPWETNAVGAGATGPTSIAVFQDGVHHVAWETEEGISYANNREGEFAQDEVAGSADGAAPSLGAGAGSVVYIAWYDTEATELIMAVRSDRRPLLAVPAPSEPTGQPTAQPTGPPPCEPSGTALSIDAPPGAAGTGFGTDCLAAAAGEAFTIEFANNDPNVPHNVAIYESQGGDSLFQGEIFPGEETMTYDVDAIEEAGQFFFQCDVHPTTMTGSFVVG